MAQSTDLKVFITTGESACDECGEMTMETRTRRFQGRTLCIPCFEAGKNRL